VIVALPYGLLFAEGAVMMEPAVLEAEFTLLREVAGLDGPALEELARRAVAAFGASGQGVPAGAIVAMAVKDSAH
jgi:hypothetical protein